MKKVYAFMAAFLAVTSFSFAQEDTTAVNDNMRIYDVVETLAEFPGGRKECMKFLAENVKYPDECIKQRIQGVVIVSFVVNKEGDVEEIKTVRSPNPTLAKEAERVVKLMPKWKPAMQDGKKVRCRFKLPVNFRLSNPQKPS